MRLFAILLLSAGLAACAPTTQFPTVNANMAADEARAQRALIIDQSIRDHQRLDRVAYPILRQNTALCEKRLARATGITVQNKYSYPTDFHAAAADALLDDRLSVIAVAPGSPADRAGIRVGDKLEAVGSTPAPQGRRAVSDYFEIVKALPAGPAAFTFTRKAEHVQVDIDPEDICNIPYSVARNTDINAYADGQKFVAHSGLLRLFTNDDDLAVIVGHEMAHNIMGHIEKGAANQMLGTAVDILLGTGSLFTRLSGQAFSQDFEAEADYVGLYMAARAGRSIADAPNVWRQMAIHAGDSTRASWSSSHPSAPQRAVALQRTVAEIDTKRANGAALLPERRPEPKPVARNELNHE